MQEGLRSVEIYLRRKYLLSMLLGTKTIMKIFFDLSATMMVVDSCTHLSFTSMTALYDIASFSSI